LTYTRMHAQAHTEIQREVRRRPPQSGPLPRPWRGTGAAVVMAGTGGTRAVALVVAAVVVGAGVHGSRGEREGEAGGTDRS
jgi:hypothetical protein